MSTQYDILPQTITDALDPHLLQTMGMSRFLESYAPGVAPPVVLGPATKHYSWPKNAALIGIGKGQFINVRVDDDARMDLKDLRRQLDACRDGKIPVVMVVVVLGSTEESAVDPLAEVAALREEYRHQGFDFPIHVDAAWGGYFATLLREPCDSNGVALPALPETTVEATLSSQVTPALRLSSYVTRQFLAIANADSATVDPHKAGYVPYPAGGMCYRNRLMRNMVAFQAPEVYHHEDDPSSGIYSVEGSKPGAASAGVYLSHRIIRPDRSGYGQILGQALFNSKRFYAAVITMAEPGDPFVVVPIQRIPAERDHWPPAEIAAQLAFIKERIVAPENNVLIADQEAMALLQELGSDQIIITYGFNFLVNGALNRDPGRANDFMQEIFKRLRACLKTNLLISNFKNRKIAGFYTNFQSH